MIRLFAAVAAATIGLDQFTKWWAVEALGDGQVVPILGQYLGFRLLYNPGAAFGTGAGYTVVLTVVAIAAVVLIVRTSRKLNDQVWAWGFGLFLGGAVGNLIDRLFREPGVMRGHVVDFIDYNGWFVGNVADIALTVAAGIIVLRAWQGIELDGSRDTGADD